MTYLYESFNISRWTRVLLFGFRNLRYFEILGQILLIKWSFYWSKINIWMKKTWLMRILVFAIRKSAQRFRLNDHVFSRLLCSTQLCTKSVSQQAIIPFLNSFSKHYSPFFACTPFQKPLQPWDMKTKTFQKLKNLPRLKIKFSG